MVADPFNCDLSDSCSCRPECAMENDKISGDQSVVFSSCAKVSGKQALRRFKVEGNRKSYFMISASCMGVTRDDCM